MTKKSNDQGRAFEFACLIVLEKKISKKRKVNIVHNSSYEVNKKSWDSLNSDIQELYLYSAEAAIEYIIKLEPRLEEDDGKLLTLEFLKDEAGIKGDVRDVTINRDNIDWEIGLSIKHNHEAVKHSRLSYKIDFGNEWLGIPCTTEYWNDVKPIFDFLIEEKEKNTKWKDLPNKEEDIYKPLLEAFMAEIKRLNNINAETPKRIIEYLIGIKDYYKIISKDAKRTTLVQTFNMYGTLNKPSKSKPITIKVPLVKLPTEIINLKFKDNSKTTIEMYLNNDWQLSFRIHNASSKIEPSLKFDIQLLGLPPSILNINCSWK